jgi:short-subunit dehydrogenase
MEQGKEIALVTGASSGIGKETAIRLAGKGYQVIVAARRLERLKELAAQLPGIVPKQVDLSNPDELEAFHRYISDLPQPVSVLVNNAGYSIRGALEDIVMDDMKRLFQVNVFALVRVTQACLPGMRRQRKGTIVNLSSVVGKFTFPMSGVYAATKYAVEGITDALRMEMRPFGINVVVIRPGPIATEFNEVANQLTGDLMARTDPEYKPVYQSAGAAVGKLFANISVPGPDLIANLILDAVLSDAPQAVYTAGPLTDIVEERARLGDDDAFDRFMTEKMGLSRLKV